MSRMPDFPVDENALVKLDRAHEALHQAHRAYNEELNEAIKRVELKHTPFLYTAQSVLYEAMANAALAGFTEAEQHQTMGCEAH